jgi:hypothetical protein
LSREAHGSQYAGLLYQYYASGFHIWTQGNSTTLNLFSEYANLCYLIQATAIVTERINGSKPQQPSAGDTKRLQVNNNKDLDVDPRDKESSFFGSFFSASKKTDKPSSKKTSMEAPPPVIRPQQALSERETMETEVISEYNSLRSTSNLPC